MDASVTIIGAGVVGLAITEELSGSYSEVFLIERHNTFGQETSSRNSEVLHAGIYYTAGSLKARLCIEGNALLYDYCKKHDVPFKKCGKLIVATDENEVEILDDLRKKAAINGVALELLEKKRISELEPEIFAVKALYSPSTGIVDSHALMKRYETNSVNNGAGIAYGAEVTGIRKVEGGYAVKVQDTSGKYEFTSSVIINAAGLMSDRIAEMAGVKDDDLKILFCKGEYFRVNPPANRYIRRLVYPVPHQNMEGIGIHVTVDMAGGVRLGPDVKYLENKIYDYSLTASKQEAFYTSAKKFLPFLKREDISPDMAGIRPKIQKPGDPQKDFYIREETQRGLPGLINLIGIESPGLTSSLSIAKYVKTLLKKMF